MRVLVTGGTGYVGAHVVRALREAGDEVTVVARDALHDSRLDEAMRDHDACAHIAIVWRDADDEDGSADVRTAAHVFDAAAREGVRRVVYASSTAVHRAHTSASDWYAVTKATNERALLSRAGISGNALRIGPVVGRAMPGTRTNGDRRFDSIARAVRAGADVCVARGEGRQFIAVTDAATAFVRVLHGEARGVHWCVARDVVTWEEIATTMIDASRSKSRIVIGAAAIEQVAPHDFDTSELEHDYGLVFTCRDAVVAHARDVVLTFS